MTKLAGLHTWHLSRS